MADKSSNQPFGSGGSGGVGQSGQPPEPGMGQCSVTGAWHPQDELVSFQGQLVSAAGKQILLDRLRTGANVPGEMERPSIMGRFGCIFVDIVLLQIFTYALRPVFGLPLIQPIGSAAASQQAKQVWPTAVIAVIVVVAVILYFGLMHGLKGRSLGKMAGKLRVVNLDGSRISMSKAFARAVAYEAGGLVISVGLILFAVMHSKPVMYGAIALGSIWGLTDVICALVDSRRQRALHDLICGTRVIREG